MSKIANQIDPLESLDALFFKLPLYAQVLLNTKQIAAIFDDHDPFSLDGYCTACRKSSTFSATGFGRTRNFNGDEYVGHLSITASCTRDPGHKLKAHLFFDHGIVEKTGQYPSLKDLSSAELRQYKGVLSPESFTELNRAVGLAAHGVGVGALVYLRRIYERLIYARFEEHKAAESWADEDFVRLRMGEKITFLKQYLPAFLVEHANIYGILSLGIHELHEERCKTLFPILKDSLLMILDEDKLEKAKAVKRAELKALLAAAAANDGG